MCMYHLIQSWPSVQSMKHLVNLHNHVPANFVHDSRCVEEVEWPVERMVIQVNLEDRLCEDTWDVDFGMVARDLDLRLDWVFIAWHDILVVELQLFPCRLFEVEHPKVLEIFTIVALEHVQAVSLREKSREASFAWRNLQVWDNHLLPGICAQIELPKVVEIVISVN